MMGLVPGISSLVCADLRANTSISDWLECCLFVLNTLPVFTVPVRGKRGGVGGGGGAVDIKLVRYRE